MILGVGVGDCGGERGERGALRQVRQVMGSRNNKERQNYGASDADAGMFTHAHAHTHAQ